MQVPNAERYHALLGGHGRCAFFWLFLTAVPSGDASAAEAARVMYSNPVANQPPRAPPGFQKFGRSRVQPKTRGRKSRAGKRRAEDLRDIVVAREAGLFSACVRKAAERQLGSRNSREKLRNWQVLLRRPSPSLYDWYVKKALAGGIWWDVRRAP